MKPLVLTTVTTLGGILRECLLSCSSSLWGSASEGRVWVSGRFLSREWGDWGKETGRPGSPPPQGKLYGLPAEPSGQAFGRLVQLSGWPCLLAKEPHGNRSPSQQTDGKFSVLLGALRVSPRLPSGHAAPGPSHHHPLPLGRPKAQGQLKTFPAGPLRAQLRRNLCSTPQG